MPKKVRREELETILAALVRFSQIAKDPRDVRLAAAARRTLQVLMPRVQGRPKARVGLGYWKYSSVVQRRVASILEDRDLEDPESVTEVSQRLIALAKRWIRPFTVAQATRLRRLAGTNAKPSEVTLTLHAWRYNLPMRTVKRLSGEARRVLIRWG